MKPRIGTNTSILGHIKNMDMSKHIYLISKLCVEKHTNIHNQGKF